MVCVCVCVYACMYVCLCAVCVCVHVRVCGRHVCVHVHVLACAVYVLCAHVTRSINMIIILFFCSHSTSEECPQAKVQEDSQEEQVAGVTRSRKGSEEVDKRRFGCYQRRYPFQSIQLNKWRTA